jgi:putative resolvase
VQRLLADPRVAAVVVERRDRLGPREHRVGGGGVSAPWRRLVVLDCGEVIDDLVRDMVVVLFTSFCARLYGRWSARDRAITAVGSTQTQYRAETCRCRG